MDTADELRQAAATLRKLADQATYGSPRDVQVFVELRNPSGYLAPSGDADSRWAATVSPDIAEPLAGLLEHAAMNTQPMADLLALDLARRINKAVEE